MLHFGLVRGFWERELNSDFAALEKRIVESSDGSLGFVFSCKFNKAETSVLVVGVVEGNID